MKKALLCLLASGLALSAPVFAQPQPMKGKPRPEEAQGVKPKRAGPPPSEEFLERLTKDLELSAEQQAKIKVVLERSRPEMEKLAAEMNALHVRMRKAMFRSKEDIRETLNLEQKQKFDEGGPRLMRGRRMGPESPDMCPAGEDCPMMKRHAGRGRTRAAQDMDQGPREESDEDAGPMPPPEDR